MFIRATQRGLYSPIPYLPAQSKSRELVYSVRAWRHAPRSWEQIWIDFISKGLAEFFTCSWRTRRGPLSELRSLPWPQWAMLAFSLALSLNKICHFEPIPLLVSKSLPCLALLHQKMHRMRISTSSSPNAQCRALQDPWSKFGPFHIIPSRPFLLRRSCRGRLIYRAGFGQQHSAYLCIYYHPAFSLL